MLRTPPKSASRKASSFLIALERKLKSKFQKRKENFRSNFVIGRSSCESRIVLVASESSWSRCDVLAWFSQPFFHPICSWPEKEDPIYHDDDVFVLCSDCERAETWPNFPRGRAGEKIWLNLLIDRLLKLIESRTCNLFSSHRDTI